MQMLKGLVRDNMGISSPSLRLSISAKGLCYRVLDRPSSSPDIRPSYSSRSREKSWTASSTASARFVFTLHFYIAKLNQYHQLDGVLRRRWTTTVFCLTTSPWRRIGSNLE